MSIIGNRLAASALMLGLLVFLQVTTGELFVLLVSIALLVLPVLQWATVYFFARRAREHPEILTLRIRVQDALAMAIVSTAGAVLGGVLVLRAVGFIGPVAREVFLIGIAYSLLMVAAPAINWLLIWRPWAAIGDMEDPA